MKFFSIQIMRKIDGELEKKNEKSLTPTVLQHWSHTTAFNSWWLGLLHHLTHYKLQVYWR